MSIGHNDALVRRVAARLPCRVGGGIRSVGRAQDLLEAGAQAVIVGSAFFDARGGRSEDGRRCIKLDFARALAETIGGNKVIAAVDSRGGRSSSTGGRRRFPSAGRRRAGRSIPLSASSSTRTSTKKG